MNHYYDNAFRIMRDGAPMRVYQKRDSELSNQIAMIELAAEAGCGIQLDDAPNFIFNPADKSGKSYQKNRQGPAPNPSPMMKRYYDGYRRAVQNGVPCRLAKLPRGAKHSLAHWAGANVPMDGWYDRAEGFAYKIADGRHDELDEYDFGSSIFARPEPEQIAASVPAEQFDLPMAA
jgi:hypothetical protein